jgi:hypothetical protein
MSRVSINPTGNGTTESDIKHDVPELVSVQANSPPPPPPQFAHLNEHKASA